ncbi:MAG: rhamnulokinase [Clostridiales bacterium]|nr:rhamnulokinase [Clostridiales bacterium]
MNRALAIDLGASSGRVTLAAFNDGRISLDEAHRFANDPVRVNGTFYWDILRILHEAKTGIAKAAANGGFDSIGIDTWGVDFALIDGHGRMVDMPVHYRDGRTDGWASLFDRISKEELYEITGIQNMQINTIYQLDYLLRHRPEDLESAKALLMTPDLLNYFLTGEMHSEYTIASTSQMLDAKARAWSKPLLERLGLDSEIFKDVVMPGTCCGTLRSGIQEETRAEAASVYCVASHDTAAAVMAIPEPEQDDYMYISSGTWSLIGTELAEPLMSEKARECNFTNEGGAGGRIRFLKNVMGSFLLQESRKQWALEGKVYSFAELDAMCEAASPIGSYIDVDDPLFIKDGDMPARIVAYCEKTGQRAPQTEGELVRVIYESLALKYRNATEEAADCTGKKFRAMHIIGGGAQSEALCRMTASATGLPVYAGPVEATTIGNAAVQWIASGAIGSVKEARQVVKECFPQREYLPDGDFAGAYEKFLNVLSKGRTM